MSGYGRSGSSCRLGWRSPRRAAWRLGHPRQAALATALAGLVFALGPRHNIPFLGSTPATGKGIALLAAIILVSAVVLVEGEAWLAR
jgi:hypothetical protein